MRNFMDRSNDINLIINDRWLDFNGNYCLDTAAIMDYRKHISNRMDNFCSDREHVKFHYNDTISIIYL